MIVVVIILSLLILILGYVTYNLYVKNLVLEKEIQRGANGYNEMLTFINELLVVYTQVYARLVRVDKNGAFESDDEVGFVFKTIKKTIEDLKHEIEKINDILAGEENAEEKEKE